MINADSRNYQKSHTLTGVWVEILVCCYIRKKRRRSHPHGCVSWNTIMITKELGNIVTPSRVCELKWHVSGVHTACKARHTLTGVWVEICRPCAIQEQGDMSHPHGCVSWNLALPKVHLLIIVTPSRVCELKWPLARAILFDSLSHPHGCVSWNFLTVPEIFIYIRSHPHGCVSWNLRALKIVRMIMWQPHGCVSCNYFNI